MKRAKGTQRSHPDTVMSGNFSLRNRFICKGKFENYNNKINRLPDTDKPLLRVRAFRQHRGNPRPQLFTIHFSLFIIHLGAQHRYIVLLPSSAFVSVTSSAYSSSAPTGTP